MGARRNKADNYSIANKIKNIRMSKNITQTKMAKMLNLDKSSMSKLENGSRLISTDELAKISDILEVSTDYLLFGKDKKHNIDDTPIDFKEAIESEYGKMFMYGGKEIPQEDLAVIKRILDSNLK